MNVLLVSNTCSKGEYERVQSLKFSEKVSPQQNFFTMLVEGLLENEGIERVICIAVRAVAKSNSNITELEPWTEHVSDRLSFIYTKVCAKNGVRNITNYCETKRTIKEVLQTYPFLRNSNTAAIIDPLAFDLTLGAIAALRDIPSIALVTDIPAFVGAIGKSSGVAKKLKYALKQQLFMYSIKNMQYFCFLTEAMNYINRQHKPYCVVEGMVPMTMEQPVQQNKNRTRVVMYAGGLYEKFGIVNLVEAAKGIQKPYFELHLYGEGNCIDYIQQVHQSNPNIIYKGVVGIDEIKAAERNSTLLVNPRPRNEEFTKYSFPSKTLEYMSAGRPVLTTELPGIPAEYFDYLYTMNDNDVETIQNRLIEVLSLPEAELDAKGACAQRFVAKNKNAKIQARKIILMAKGICNEEIS